MKNALIVFLFLTLGANCWAHSEAPGEIADEDYVVEKIYDLMAILKDVEFFGLGSIPTFFPIEKEFFEVLDYLQDINVNWFTVTNLRNSTLSEVRAIQQMFYAHGTGISHFVEILFETVHLVQAKDKDVQALNANMRAIVRTATGLVSELMAIVERIELHAATFQYKIEKAIQLVKSANPETVTKIRERVIKISSSYSTHYEELYEMLERAHTNFDVFLPALRVYISTVSA